jgi:ribonuclease BN (tRNA processing enzyme)
MQLTVVGCSPAWPNPDGAQSGYLVDDRVLLDCGPGVLARLRSTAVWPDVAAVVLTHWHLDHWGDLIPWVWGGLVGPGQSMEPPELWVPPNGISMLEQFGELLGFPDMFERVFRLHQYDEDTAFETAGLAVHPLRLPHYTLETYGLRVESDGRVLAYSGDSAPSDRLAELARDADLFVCEATLERGELDATPRGHLSLDEAAAAFEASGAKRLLLTHRPAELSLPAGFEQAHDGMVLELG